MAILDDALRLSGSWAGGTWTAQNVFASGASVVSTNVVDTTGGTGAAQSVDLGKGEPLYLEIDVITAFSGGTSAEFQFCSADNTALSTNLTVICSSGAIPIASLTAGKKIYVPIPPVEPRTLRRYVGMNVVNVGANAAGAVLANIVHGKPAGAQFSPTSGFTVN